MSTKNITIEDVDQKITAINTTLVVTQEDIRNLSAKLDEKFNRIMESVDWLVGEYKKHSEDHIFLGNRLEKVENKIGINV